MILEVSGMLRDRRSEVLAVVSSLYRCAGTQCRIWCLTRRSKFFEAFAPPTQFSGHFKASLIASLWRAHASITLTPLLYGWLLFVALVGSRKIKRHRVRLVPTPPSIKRRFNHVQDRILHVRFHHTRTELHRKITLVHSLINQ